MSNIGMGVLIARFGGNAESVDAFTGAMGKTISALALDANDVLQFEFTDGTKLMIADKGQSCCESRYMRTDDNLSDFVGAKLLGAEIKQAPDVPADYEYASGSHEVQFLEVQTTRGVFTMASHNEHNGYYGGFSIEASVE